MLLVILFNIDQSSKEVYVCVASEKTFLYLLLTQLRFMDQPDLFSQVSSSLSADGQAIIRVIQNEFSKFKNDIMQIVHRKNEEISDLRTKVTSLEKQINGIKILMDDQEAYSRRDSVVLSGDALPAAVVGENAI